MSEMYGGNLEDVLHDEAWEHQLEGVKFAGMDESDLAVVEFVKRDLLVKRMGVEQREKFMVSIREDLLLCASDDAWRAAEVGWSLDDLTQSQ